MSNNVSNKKSLIKTANKLIENGLSVIPVNIRTKTSIAAWKKYQETIIKFPKIKKVLNDPDNNKTGIAIIGGKVSGSLEFMDFDFHLNYFEEFKKIVENAKPKLWEKLYIEKTQSGFRHIAYRCIDAKHLPTTKLAYKLVKAKKLSRSGKKAKYKGKTHIVHEIDGKKYVAPVIIETKGEGGYCVCAPSKGYRELQGSLSKLSTISVKQRNFLHRVARSLNEKVKPEEIESGVKKATTTQDKRPGDIYNETGDPCQVLIDHGWKPLPKPNVKNKLFMRPGKKNGVSASLIDGQTFYCFSTNASPFEANKGYAPFAVYALLKHNGDYSAAAMALMEQGYVSDQGNLTENTNGKLPEPIIYEKELKVPIFPTHVLPTILRKYVTERAKQFSVCEDVIAVPALVLIAGFIGRIPHIRPFSNSPNWMERAAVWGMIIGETGTNKSSPMRETLKFLTAFDAERQEAYKKDKDFYDNQIKKQKGGKNKKAKKVKIPDKPVERRIVVYDATIEKVAKLMEDSTGLTLVRDELSGFIKNMSRYSHGSDEAFFLQCFRGGDYKLDRMDRETKGIKDLYLNIIGTIQPKMVCDLFKPNEAGMIERFGLMSYSPQPQWKQYDKKPNHSLDKRIKAAGRCLLNAEWKSLLKNQNDKLFLALSKKAEKHFSKWMKTHMQLVRSKHGTKLGGMYNKMRGHILSLALILHLFKWADNETSKLKVSIKSLKSAITLYENFFAPTWHRVFQVIEKTEFDKNVEVVRSYLLRKKLSEVKARDIQSQKMGSLSKVQDIENVLDFFISQKWILRYEIRKNPAGGRKSKVYIINPRIHELN